MVCLERLSKYSQQSFPGRGSHPADGAFRAYSLQQHVARSGAAISLPYTHRFMLLSHHGIGSPALDRLSSAACRPCYPGRSHPPLPFSQRMSSGLPQLTRGSDSPTRVTRLPVGSLALRPAPSPCGNLRPLIAQPPLPRATQSYGQLLGGDFNPQDKRLLLRTAIS